jgi:hypothetical protein
MVVLETDEPHPDDHHEKGSLGEILHQHFDKAGQSHDPPLGVETDMVFVVKEKGGRIPRIEEFEGVQGVLITGSMYDAHGDDQWILDLLELLKSTSEAPQASLYPLSTLLSACPRWTLTKQTCGRHTPTCTSAAFASGISSYLAY